MTLLSCNVGKDVTFKQKDHMEKTGIDVGWTAVHIYVLINCAFVDRRGGEEAEGESDVGRTHSVHGTRDAESAGKHLYRRTDRRHPQSEGTCVSTLMIHLLKL